jgi:putative ABC transport system ATP-binding protein
MTEPLPILETEHLTLRIGDQTIVDDVTIAVPRKQLVAIVGPSGAGKSSFLRLLNRLTEPSEGRVYLNGQDTREIPPAELRCRVGMMMQTPHLFPGTVAENVRFGPEQHGKNLDDETVDRLLSRVGLDDYAGREIHNLSVGEAQRVSLARILANAPEVLLLDEPTSALDENAEARAEALICEILRDHDLTGLVVTHDMAQARRIADRVMVFEKGKLKDYGPTSEVLDA